MVDFKKNKQEYATKVQRMLDAADNKVPDRIPVCSFIESYALAYAGVTIGETEGHMLKHVKGYGSIYKDIYFDCAYVPSLTHSIKLGRTLGSEVFFASDDGYTLQHKEDCPMTPEDYKKIAEDPVMWILDEFLPRKFPNFDVTNEQQLKSFYSSLPPFLEFAGSLVLGYFYFEKFLGMPVVVGGSAEMPTDLFFDFLRGFKGTTIDLRRNKDDFIKAKDAAAEYCYDLIKMTHLMMTMPPHIKDLPWLVDYGINAVVKGGEPKLKPFPWILNPCHMPPFLNDQQFEEIYLDDFVDIATYIQNHGGHMFTVLEGQWGQRKLELLNERVPAHSVTFVVENDDIFECKKLFGTKHSIMGGMPLAMLRESSKSECVDYAKKLVDELGVDGGYLFATDKVLLAPGDVDIRNLAAVNEFVHVYGQY
ncbi:MAG: hypothetical protein MJ111_00695 [Clostridia bacterium]|nr:hypothetical protein [Clostridia bacterium]